jgi:hypothetical protein
VLGTLACQGCDLLSLILLFLEEEALLPNGFSYYPDFITADEERRLLDVISILELHPLVFQGFEARRKVESYGYDYNFDRRTITKGKDIPARLIFLMRK